MATARQTERTEAADRLREWIAPGDTLYTILRHRSSSGMLRVIDIYKLPTEVDGRPLAIGWNAAIAMDDRYDRDRNGIRVGGAGMDMGFHLVYNLGATLWPAGYECPGDRCQSNDHTNGDRDYTPHHHDDGGYALRHSWL